METINEYINVRRDLGLAREMKQILEDEKERIYCEFFSQSSNVGQEPQTKGFRKDKMVAYLEIIGMPDINGKTLDDRILDQKIKIDGIKEHYNECVKSLKEDDNSHSHLFYLIVIENVGISIAVATVAEKFGKSEKTIWRNEYKNIEKQLSRIRILTDSFSL